jgi:ABC-type branched-subunit amino acid transport system ATPase component/ABC-type branched-subunit amino acid transport system permease subunit
MRPRLILALFAVVLALLAIIPGVPPFWITLLNNIGLAALVAIGLVLLTGVGGMTSFGQAAFCGFGAYTTAILTTTYGLSPWLSLPVALVVTGVAAVLLGLITVRLSGHYLPLGTLAWGISLYYLFGRIDLLGRNDGISGIPPLSIGPWSLIDPKATYWVIWIFVLLAGIGTSNLLSSRIGRAIRALRRGGVAAESFGVERMRVKLVVFVYAALLAGLSGWLYAHLQRSVNPTPFGLGAGIEYLLMATIGGAGHVWGGLLGAGVVVILKDALQRILPAALGSDVQAETIVFGIVLVATLQVAREGLWPYLAALFPAPSPIAAPADAKPLVRRAAAADVSPLLESEGLSKRFGGIIAVNDVSVAIAPCAIVGLIGPNGAGKSTMFNLITGILTPTSGNVCFAGEPITGRRPGDIARRGIARTFQHVKLMPEMSVLENVALGAHLRGRSGVLASILHLERAEEGRLLAEAARQIARVGLADQVDRSAGSLPLGQQRILEIARALCLDPRLLLLDEPAAGLREFEKRMLVDLLNQLRAEGMTMLLVEHDMSFVMGLVDRIVVLDFGNKIAEGAPAAIKADPAVLAAYLGAES